jgi:hypothetical protein
LPKTKSRKGFCAGIFFSPAWAERAIGAERICRGFSLKPAGLTEAISFFSPAAVPFGEIPQRSVLFSAGAPR